MALELLHYVHCPFCIRVRMALGYLGLSWKSTVVPYNDAETLIRLTGKKMLPIMLIDGKPMNESLEIIRSLDDADSLKHEITKQADWTELEKLLSLLSNNVHNLAMPYWIWSPEFDVESRQYFQEQKTVKRGPFKELRAKRSQFEKAILNDLNTNIPQNTFWDSTTISVKDIAIASQVWGLFAVPEFRFPQVWHDYLMRVKEACQFEYHAGHWSQK